MANPNPLYGTGIFRRRIHLRADDNAVAVELEDGNLEVQRLDGRRVDRVKFTPRPLPEGADAEGGEPR